MYIKENERLLSQLNGFLLDHRSMTGAKVLTTLLLRPDRPVCVSEIAYRIYGYDISPLDFQTVSKTAFTPIPISDKYAQKQYLERLRLLRARKMAGNTRLDWEIEMLAKELRRITKAGGSIRNEYPELKKAYTCFKVGLNRLLAHAEFLGHPALADYIRNHLRTGLWCCWHSDPRTKKVSHRSHG